MNELGSRTTYTRLQVDVDGARWSEVHDVKPGHYVTLTKEWYVKLGHDLPPRRMLSQWRECTRVWVD